MPPHQTGDAVAFIAPPQTPVRTPSAWRPRLDATRPRRRMLALAAQGVAHRCRNRTKRDSRRSAPAQRGDRAPGHHGVDRTGAGDRTSLDRTATGRAMNRTAMPEAELKLAATVFQESTEGMICLPIGTGRDTRSDHG